MSFLEIAQLRQSDRSYADKSVEREKIERCIDAARIAPSACNSQPWHFVVVDEKETLAALADTANAKVLKMNRFVDQAPVMIAIVNEGMNAMSKIGSIVKNKSYDRFDLGIAAEHICLQAVSEGLGSCILGWFDEKKAKKVLNIPSKKRLELLITIGYKKDDKLRQKVRKTSGEILSYNNYSK